MTTHYVNRNRKLPSPCRKELLKLIRCAVPAARLPETPDWDLEIMFVDDAAMTKYNMDILGHTGTTDVITMSYFDQPEELFPGDTAIELIINTSYAQREAAKRGLTYGSEAALYLIHGLLHASGEDDLVPDKRRRMRRREREVMAAVRKAGASPEAAFPENN